MGATLYKEFKVFKMDVGLQYDDLFGTSETIVVASNHCEKNCFPHTYKWSFEFIGSLNSLQNIYLPKTAYFFDDGLSQSKTLANGKAFTSHVKSLYETAGPMKVNDLHEIGWFGYSWSEVTCSKFESTDHLKLFKYWLGTRYAARIETQADIESMLHEAYIAVPPGSEHPWIGCLWRLDASQVGKIQAAPVGTDFRMAI